jgi:hypothetical protein
MQRIASSDHLQRLRLSRARPIRRYRQAVTLMDAPQLGIFWFVSDPPRQVHILAVVCPLSAADEYGDCLTCLAGHYLTWHAWRRGRIIYEQPPDRFVIYVDRQLLAAPRLLQIRTHFHLPPQ